MFNIDQTAKGTGHILTSSLRLVVSPMPASEDKPWFEVYKAAMLELDRQKLSERIIAAKEAVQLRLKDIEGDNDHHAERQQIEYALNGLKVLERVK